MENNSDTFEWKTSNEEKETLVLWLVTAAKYQYEQGDIDSSLNFMFEALENESCNSLLRTKISFQIACLLKNKNLPSAYKFIRATIKQICTLPPMIVGTEKNDILLASLFESISICREMQQNKELELAINEALCISHSISYLSYYQLVFHSTTALLLNGEIKMAQLLIQGTIENVAIPQRHTYIRLILEIEKIRTFILSGEYAQADDALTNVKNEVNNFHSLNLFTWQQDIILALLSSFNVIIAIILGKASEVVHFANFISTMDLKHVLSKMENDDSNPSDQDLTFASVDQLNFLVKFILLISSEHVSINDCQILSRLPSQECDNNIENTYDEYLQTSKCFYMIFSILKLLQMSDFQESVLYLQKLLCTCIYQKTNNIILQPIIWLVLSTLQCAAGNMIESRKCWHKAYSLTGSNFKILKYTLASSAIAIDSVGFSEKFLNSSPVPTTMDLLLPTLRNENLSLPVHTMEGKLFVALKQILDSVHQNDILHSRNTLLYMVNECEKSANRILKKYLYLLMIVLDITFGTFYNIMVTVSRICSTFTDPNHKLANNLFQIIIHQISMRFPYAHQSQNLIACSSNKSMVEKYFEDLDRFGASLSVIEQNLE